ncbi:MAG TPA: PfkB family carbohydrate kinase, partial [Nannocystis sp.]
LGAEVLRALRAADVDLEHVTAIRSEATGVALVIVRADGDKTILLVPGANASWPESDPTVVRAISTAAPGSVLTLDLEASPAIALEAARTAHARGLAVVLDPSPAQRMLEGLYGLVDVMTPNASEAATLTGVEVEDVASAVQAGERLRARGVGYACVKLPGGGCVLVGAGRPVTLPPLSVPVVDTTGAGDAFAAALAVAWLKGQEPAQAAALATVAASLAVSGYGAQPAYPDRATLERGLIELEHQRG